MTFKEELSNQLDEVRHICIRDEWSKRAEEEVIFHIIDIIEKRLEVLSDEEILAVNSPGRKRGLLEALYDSIGREAISYQINLAQAQVDEIKKRLRE